MDNTENLKIALIEQDKKVAEKIGTDFKFQQNEVTLFDKIENNELMQKLKNGDFDTLIVNFFSDPSRIDIINFISDEKMPVPVCLLGTMEQFLNGGINEKFMSYCSLKTDENDLEEKIKEMNMQLRRCRTALKKKKIFKSKITIDQEYKDLEKEIKGFEQDKLQNYENNIKPKLEKEAEQKLKDKFISGLDVGQLNGLISKTLKETSKTIEQYKWVNIVIIVFGLSLVFYAVKYDRLDFGGLGLAGIIASLIANPVNSINRTARQAIQIQITYLGFLKQIDILNKVRKDDTIDIAIRQSECLERTIISLQKALSEYFDEHKKVNDKNKPKNTEPEYE